MGCGWLKWCSLLLLLTPGYIRLGNASCTIRVWPGEYCDEYPTIGDSTFTVHSDPSGYVEIECLNSPEWSDFPFQSANGVNFSHELEIRNCPLPNTSFPEIIKKLGNDVLPEKFVFGDYKFHLTLERRHLTGFPALERLYINDNVLLKISADVFRDLSKLVSLSLNDDSLTHLPSGIFDGLSELEELNLRDNKLTRLQPELFVNLSRISTLDISGNSLNVLPADIFKPLANLQSLYMGNNDFSSLPEILLAENNNLISIALHDNKQNLTTLPSSFLRNLTKLTEVSLFNNGLISLPEDILWGASSLEWLNLNGNCLTTLPRYIFKDLGNLNYLALRDNNLRHLPGGLFAALNELKRLALSKNHLTTVSETLFFGLTSLKDLKVDENDLKIIPENCLTYMHELRDADFSHNQLTFENAKTSPFRYCTQLHVLLLNNNNITTVPDDSLSNEQLYKLDLSYNQISLVDNLTTLSSNFLRNSPTLATLVLRKAGLLSLPEDILWGVPSLEEVDFSGNFLTELPTQIFKDLGNLYSLELSDNNLNDLPDGLFAALSKLVYLSLSKNHLTTISEKFFSGLTGLGYLNVDENNLEIIHDNSLTSLHRLRFAIFSHNQLTFGRAKTSPFRNCTQLEELRLDNNNITTVFNDWLSNENLRILNLSYNQISSVDVRHTLVTSRVTEVNLRYNDIRTVTAPISGDGKGHLSMTTTRILFDGNLIHCDHEITWFLEFVRQSRLILLFPMKRIDYEDLVCKSPIWLQGQLVSVVDPSSMPSLVNNTSCGGCCPEECTCWTRESKRTFIVECSYRNISEAPKLIIGLEGYRNIVVNLTGNSLTEIPRVDRDGYEYVTKLLLSHNNISRIGLETLEALKCPPSLTAVTLHENPWKCDYDAIDFIRFLQRKPRRVIESQNITCGDKTNESLATIDTNGLYQANKRLVVDMSVALSLLGMLIVAILMIFYCKYQREVKVWLYARRMCLRCVTEEDLDRDKLFDAFISYSHKDEDFVLDELVTKLEEGLTPFKLCLHIRDWLGGDWISEQIARSVENSRRTIIVLSRNFLESCWGRLEFRAAHKQSLKDRRTRVILVLFGDIGPTDDLDPELKLYLTMNTYVKWGDPYFWDQLRYALPHAPKMRERSGSEEIRISNDVNAIAI